MASDSQLQSELEHAITDGDIQVSMAKNIDSEGTTAMLIMVKDRALRLAIESAVQRCGFCILDWPIGKMVK